MSSFQLTVKDMMTTQVVTVGRNDKLSIAEDVMKQERIRHLPVKDDDGVVCGIVSQRDLFRGALLRSLGYGSRAEELLLSQVDIKEVMTEKVITVAPDTEAATAAKIMLDNQIGCLPVVMGEELLGLVSETDFVKLAVSSRASVEASG